MEQHEVGVLRAATSPKRKTVVYDRVCVAAGGGHDVAPVTGDDDRDTLGPDHEAETAGTVACAGTSGCRGLRVSALSHSARQP
jgi:hypothetical protein